VDRALGAAAGAAASALGEAVAASDEPVPRSAIASLASAGGVLGGEAIASAAADVSPAAAWSALRAFLDKHCTPERNFAPSEAAARAALAAGANASLRLPQWLVRRFTRGRAEGTSGGMARRGSNPTALLVAYVQNGRLEEAARLALAELRAHAAGTDAVTRTKFTAAWFPTPLLMHVCDLTAQDTALDGLRLELEAELDKHRRRSEADTAKLAGFAR
jgi:nuclear pore complex protein Nup160